MSNYDLLRYKIENGTKHDYIPLTIQKDLFNDTISDKIINLKNNITNLVKNLNTTKLNLQKNIELLTLLLIDTYKMGIYLGMAIAALSSLVWQLKLADASAAAMAPVGAAFTFIALLTGAAWGKPMWGTWWIWDARLTSELILLFLYHHQILKLHMLQVMIYSLKIY